MSGQVTYAMKARTSAMVGAKQVLSISGGFVPVWNSRVLYALCIQHATSISHRGSQQGRLYPLQLGDPMVTVGLLLVALAVIVRRLGRI